MHAYIAEKREELAELCRRYDAVRLEVFGSTARATDFDSDPGNACFLVEFDPDSTLSLFVQYFGLVEALRKTLGCPCVPDRSMGGSESLSACCYPHIT